MSADPSAPSRELLDELVAMPDGVRLATDVYLPDGAGPWPAALVRTPYGREGMREEARHLVRDGIAVAVQDVRGRFGSQGRFDLLASDGTDGAHAVAWAAAQPWCDGRVGMRGASYMGMTQWRAALERPETLVCIAPTMCPPWWNRLSFREGGAVKLALAAHWLPLQAGWDPSTPDEVRARCFERAFVFEDPTVVVDGRVSVPGALAHPALGRARLRDPWPVEGAPLYEEVWTSVFDPPEWVSWLDDPGPAPTERVDVPTLVVGSWYDLGWSHGQVEAFRMLRERSAPEIAAQHRLVMAPHGHGFDPLRDYDPGAEGWRFHLWSDWEWLRERLLGDRSAFADLAPVTYFALGENIWRSADSFPPPGARPESLFILPTPQGLGTAPPGGGDAAELVYDPADPVPTRGGPGIGLPPGPADQAGLTGGARPDVLSFTSAPTDQSLEIAGPVVVELYASSDAPDTDFTAKLCDVAPDGTVMSITDGILRARYRHGPDPVLLEPGRVERFRIHAGCVAWVIRPGHRIRLDISSSSFPKYDRNPNTGGPEGTDTAFRTARQRIVASPEHPSRVELTVVR